MATCNMTYTYYLCSLSTKLFYMQTHMAIPLSHVMTDHPEELQRNLSSDVPLIASTYCDKSGSCSSARRVLRMYKHTSMYMG